jgi:TolB-like protein/class 3 adenylate cyclase/tetratricopeptide (TPR) repeat protein
MAAPRKVRRLTAILAADVVGYSRLMGEDEAGTHARLMAHRKEFIEPLVAEYRGRLVKLNGDGALVEFASALDAVECAVVIQRGVAEREAPEPASRRFLFRIGINLGDIILDEDDIYGDGVNVAYRLEGLAEPGGICIARKVHDEVKNKLNLGFQPMGEHRVKNIAEPITVYRVLPGPSGTARMTRHAAIARVLGGPPPVAIAAAVILMLAAGMAGAWYALWQPTPEPTTPVVAEAAARPALPSPERPSIAVLPFENFSGDKTTGRLADGITEDIITDLARFRDLDVIARNSTAVYKGRPVDVRQVGEDLSVGYVLAGSIQRQTNRVRVTAQLVNTRSGSHAWSERWDRPVEDVFAVQGEIAEQVAGRLGGGLSEAIITTNEARRAKRLAPKDLTAYDHYVLAAEAKALRTEQAVARGLAHVEQAITLDPSFARAYVARGVLRYITISSGANWATTIEQVGADFRKAVELDPADAEAVAELGFWYSEKGRMAEAVAHIQRALDLNHANIHVLVEASSTLPYAGRVEQALEVAEKAIRLDPRMTPTSRTSIKDAFFFGRQFERTVEVVEAIPEEKRSRFARLALAASYAFLGRTEEAAAAKALFVARHGEPSAELWLNQGFSFARERERDLFVDGFRKLGLPVCASPEDLAGINTPKRLPDCSKVPMPTTAQSPRM